MGLVGRGKTFAAAAMVSSWDIHALTWVGAPMLMARLRSTFRDGSRESELDVIREMANPGVMVLDDFGAEKGSEYSLSSLYCILSERENQKLSTVVTTNLDLSLIQSLDARIASRLAGYHAIEVLGEDRRIPVSHNPDGLIG
jgi:DNA replication protein DnaC